MKVTGITLLWILLSYFEIGRSAVNSGFRFSWALTYFDTVLNYEYLKCQSWELNLKIYYCVFMSKFDDRTDTQSTAEATKVGVRMVPSPHKGVHFL